MGRNDGDTGKPEVEVRVVPDVVDNEVGDCERGMVLLFAFVGTKVGAREGAIVEFCGSGIGSTGIYVGTKVNDGDSDACVVGCEDGKNDSLESP